MAIIGDLSRIVFGDTRILLTALFRGKSFVVHSALPVPSTTPQVLCACSPAPVFALMAAFFATRPASRRIHRHHQFRKQIPRQMVAMIQQDLFSDRNQGKTSSPSIFRLIEPSRTYVRSAARHRPIIRPRMAEAANRKRDASLAENKGDEVYLDCDLRKVAESWRPFARGICSGIG